MRGRTLRKAAWLACAVFSICGAAHDASAQSNRQPVPYTLELTVR
jgi:hypothetical protein